MYFVLDVCAHNCLPQTYTVSFTSSYSHTLVDTPIHDIRNRLLHVHSLGKLTCSTIRVGAPGEDLFRWDCLPVETFSETFLDWSVRIRSCHTTTHTLHIGALISIKDAHMQCASPIQQVQISK